jgi:N-acetyl-anhydromuramyl-L-alanine amidase AmpD
MKRLGTDLLVFHCSATKPSQHIGRAQIEEWHLAKGWAAIGYHFVITRAGDVELGRPLEELGAHVQGFNGRSVGICMVGGLDDQGRELVNAPQMFTPAQWIAAHKLVDFLRTVWRDARICGHRDLSPDKNADGRIERTEWLKSCPGFDAAAQFAV